MYRAMRTLAGYSIIIVIIVIIMLFITITITITITLTLTLTLTITITLTLTLTITIIYLLLIITIIATALGSRLETEDRSISPLPTYASKMPSSKMSGDQRERGSAPKGGSALCDIFRPVGKTLPVECPSV